MPTTEATARIASTMMAQKAREFMSQCREKQPGKRQTAGRF
jgi:hypothetical protein